MSEKIVSKEKCRVLLYPTILILGGIGLTGCSEIDATTLNPVERVAYEYIDMSNGLEDSQPFNNTIGCLNGTAFDVTAGDRGKASFLPPSASYDAELDVLSLTSAQGQVLNLEGFKQFEHTVTAVDAESQKILDSYGCEVGEYVS